MVPVTTCSPRNFGRVKSSKAAEAFDYILTSYVSDIRAFTNNSVEHVFDCISDTQSVKICQAASGNKRGPLRRVGPASRTCSLTSGCENRMYHPIQHVRLECIVDKSHTCEIPSPRIASWRKTGIGLRRSCLTITLCSFQPWKNERGGFEGLIGWHYLLTRCAGGKVIGSKLVYRY